MTTCLLNRLGICSWSLHPRDPQDMLDTLDRLGLRHVQLAIDPVRQQPRIWQQVASHCSRRGVTIASGMVRTVDEDYSTLDTIRATGGIVPDSTWQTNWRNIMANVRLAAAMGIRLVSMHIGFLPDPHDQPAFQKLQQRAAEIARMMQQHEQILLFETGQETAETLKQFLAALHDRGIANTGVNFDPANMILYGKGDPIDALRRLIPHVRQVHIKDALPGDTPGQWGRETPIGDGAVDWRAFFDVLRASAFRGPVVIEREAGGEHINDVLSAIRFLRNLLDH